MTEAENISEEDFKMKINLKKNTDIKNIYFKEQRGILSKRLKQSLVNLRKPFAYDFK